MYKCWKVKSRSYPRKQEEKNKTPGVLERPVERFIGSFLRKAAEL